MNNNGPFSTDYLGGELGLPECELPGAGSIRQAHRDYTAGLLYFLANDPQVPAETRKEMNGGVFARTNSPIAATGLFSYIFARRDAWWASS